MVAKFIPVKYGEESSRVIKIQKLLAKAGSSIKPNGCFTIGMRTAVKSFQAKHNLPVTGIVDARTMNKLATYDKPSPRKKK